MDILLEKMRTAIPQLQRLEERIFSLGVPHSKHRHWQQFDQGQGNFLHSASHGRLSLVWGVKLTIATRSVVLHLSVIDGEPDGNALKVIRPFPDDGMLSVNAHWLGTHSSLHDGLFRPLMRLHAWPDIGNRMVLIKHMDAIVDAAILFFVGHASGFTLQR